MEELRVAFLVIGSIFIVGVLVHGIWKMRSEDRVPKSEQEKVEPSSYFDEINDTETQDKGSNDRDANDNEQAFDEYGVGSVRIIASDLQSSIDDAVSVSQASHSSEAVSEENSDPLESIPVMTDDALNDSSLAFSETQSESAPDASVPDTTAPPLYASVITQPKPHMSASPSTFDEQKNNQNSDKKTSSDIPDPPSFLLKEHDPETHSKVTIQAEPDFGLSRPYTPPEKEHTEQKASKESRKSVVKRSATRKRKEPTLGEDQMRIDFDEPKESAPKISEPAEPQRDQKVNNATEVLAINVRASDEHPLSGAALLPLLLTLGFKFGEHDIFHRHVNANGKGPVLFSLANMVKPGVFDIDNLETFTTQGVSLFMVLPIEGDPHQVFNMMHNAARKIAEEFNAQLLDASRSILTKQGVQQYVEKIREFERQRIIASNSTR